MDESPLLHDQLLATKFFIPSSSHVLIPRPRLTELLNMSLECPLTLVSAPAGFGKTTLLSSWVRALPLERSRIAWVSLDEGDNEPALFWMYVLSLPVTISARGMPPWLSASRHLPICQNRIS